MQLGPNRSYIMVFVVAAMLLMLAVALSRSKYFHHGGLDTTIGETMPLSIERHYKE